VAESANYDDEILAYPLHIAPRVRRVKAMSLHAQSLALGAADYTWRNEALCRDTDPELFFPVGNTGDAIGQIELARTVCNDCQVRTQCLEFALATNQDCGVWGGTSEDERRRIRRERAAMRRMGHPAGA